MSGDNFSITTGIDATTEGIIIKRDYKIEVMEALESIKLNSEDSMAWSKLGFALSWLGDLDRSEEAYRKVVEFEPKNAKAHFNLGDILCGNRSADEAVLCYEKAIKLDPNEYEFYSNLALALEQLDIVDTAKIIFNYEKSIEIKSDNLAAILALKKYK